MKVLGIGCSPRKGGNTDILLGEALAGAQQNGAEVEQLSIRELDIKPCDGCYSCAKKGKCKIKDDMQLVYDKMLAADGIIFSVPIYFWAMCGLGGPGPDPGGEPARDAKWSPTRSTTWP